MSATLRWLLLCDGFTQEPDGALSIRGIRDTLFVTAFPASVEVTAVALLDAHAEATAFLRFAIETPTGRLAAPDSARLSLRPGETFRVGKPLPFRASGPGAAHVSVILDGNELGRAPLELRLRAH